MGVAVWGRGCVWACVSACADVRGNNVAVNYIYLIVSLIYSVPPKCSNLTNPAHGLAIMGLGNYSVRYLCNYPYYLHGSENRKCINGNWTDSDPICVLGKKSQPITIVLINIVQNAFTQFAHNFFRRPNLVKSMRVF